MTGGEIAGVVLGVVLSIVLLSAILFIIWKKLNKTPTNWNCFELSSLRTQQENINPETISSDPLIPTNVEDVQVENDQESPVLNFRPHQRVQECTCLISWGTFPSWRHNDSEAVESLMQELFEEHQQENHFGKFPGEIIAKTVQFDQVKL